VKEEAAVVRREEAQLPEAQVPWQMVRGKAAAEVDPAPELVDAAALPPSIKPPS